MSERVALLVMGVHRSGTSALTRVLSLLGAGLPSELLGPARGNPRGHWEPKRLVALDDEIFRTFGEDWWDPAAIPPDWFDGAEAAAFAVRIAALIAEEYGDQPLIVIKDPRLCRLAPLFFTALNALGMRPRAILPLRFPGEVIRSISARDELSPEITELLWLRHMIEAEFHSRRCPRAWTSFDGLLADWRGETDRIAHATDLEWPVPPDTAAAGIETTLVGSLRHFDPASAAPVGPLVQRVWDAAQRALAGDEAAARTEFDAVRAVIDELDRLGAARHTALRDAQATAAREQTRLTEALAAASAQIARLHVAPARRVAEIAALQATIDSLQGKLDDVLASPSWRVTAPLRKVAGWVGS